MESSLEDQKDFLADMLNKEIISYPQKILTDFQKKLHYINIPANEIFVCGMFNETWVLTVNTDEHGISFPSGLNLQTKHTFVKIKEGLSDFGEWMDFPGINKNALRRAGIEAEFEGRKSLTDFIGERGQVKGVELKNDQFSFDENLNNIISSNYDIRDVNISKLGNELTQISKIIKEKSKNQIKHIDTDMFSSLEMTLTANSSGALVYQKIPRTMLDIHTFAYPKGVPESKRFRFGVTGGLDLFYDFLDSKTFDFNDVLDDIVQESIDFFYNSKTIEQTGFKSYKGLNILMAPKPAGVFAHEALGHHVEQDLEDSEFGARFLRDHIGEKVSDGGLNISFNPLHKDEYRGFGFYFYDNEGTKTFPTKIIDDDIAIDTLTDLSSASLYNVKPNAHSRGDWIRMSNLLIGGKSTLPPNDMFREIAGKGYFIKRAYSGFTSEALKQSRVLIDSLYFIDRNLDLIPIKTVAPPSSKKRELASIEYYLSVDSLDLLHNIQAIGKNTSSVGLPIKYPFLGAGYCGKGNWGWEFQPVAEGGAYLLLNNILLTKNEMDAPRTGFIKPY